MASKLSTYFNPLIWAYRIICASYRQLNCLPTVNLLEKILYMKGTLIHRFSHPWFWQDSLELTHCSQISYEMTAKIPPNLYWCKRSSIGTYLQEMDGGLGSITQKVNTNGSNGSGDLKETFIRKRISSPNPISKGKANNKSC